MPSIAPGLSPPSWFTHSLDYLSSLMSHQSLHNLHLVRMGLLYLVPIYISRKKNIQVFVKSTT